MGKVDPPAYILKLEVVKTRNIYPLKNLHYSRSLCVFIYYKKIACLVFHRSITSYNRGLHLITGIINVIHFTLSPQDTQLVAGGMTRSSIAKWYRQKAA